MFYPTASSLPVAFLSFSPSLSDSFSGPHPLLEEVSFSLPLLFSPTAADEPQVRGTSSSVEAVRCRCASVGGAVERSEMSDSGFSQSMSRIVSLVAVLFLVLFSRKVARIHPHNPQKLFLL